MPGSKRKLYCKGSVVPGLSFAGLPKKFVIHSGFGDIPTLLNAIRAGMIGQVMKLL